MSVEPPVGASFESSVEPSVGGHYGPVGDPLVRLVAETFAAVLGRPAVPPHLSFFALGGSSLQAARACTRIGKQAGRPVPLSRLYEHASAEHLGSWLRSARDTDAAPRPAGDVPLTAMESVFLTRHLTAPQDRSPYCLMTWHLDGRLDQDRLEAAVAAVHERHQTLRTAFRPDPRPHAEVTDISAPPLELLDARPTVDEAVRALRRLFEEPLEPQDADLWRTALVPVTQTGGRLFGVLVHHIVFDGRSESVLARDLSDAYAGREPRYAPPTLAERARLTAAATAGTDAAGRTARVRAEFQDVPEIHWPERPGPGETGTGHLHMSVPAPVTAHLDARGAALGVSRFVVLLSAWAGTMAEVCRQRDFAVGVPVAERTVPELEEAIGCRINMVPVRLRGAALRGGEDGIRETGDGSTGPSAAAMSPSRPSRRASRRRRPVGRRCSSPSSPSRTTLRPGSTCPASSPRICAGRTRPFPWNCTSKCGPTRTGPSTWCSPSGVTPSPRPPHRSCSTASMTVLP